MMMIAGLAFVATLTFEIPFAKLEGMLIGGKMGMNSLIQHNFAVISSIKIYVCHTITLLSDFTMKHLLFQP